MVIKLLYKFQIDRKRNKLARVPNFLYRIVSDGADGRNAGRSGATPRPALADGNTGKINDIKLSLKVL